MCSDDQRGRTREGLVIMELWRSMLRALDTRKTRGGSGIAEEVEAFLQGRLLERLCATGSCGTAPAWMWMNAVAHGDRALVESLVAGSSATARHASGWSRARAQLALELLDCSGGGTQAMRALQDQVLIPLELRLSDVPHLTPALFADIGARELRLARPS